MDGFREVFLIDDPPSGIVDVFLFRVSRSTKVEDFLFFGTSNGMEEAFRAGTASSVMDDVFLFPDRMSVNVEDFLWDCASGTEESFLMFLLLNSFYFKKNKERKNAEKNAKFHLQSKLSSLP